MATQNKNPKKQPAPTQQHLPVADVREGIVVLKDGSLRLIMLSTSINFDLKSLDEQNAIVYAYQSFLNSLDFPIQIVMQSRKFNLSSYLSKLKERVPETESELLRIQIQDYVHFIERLLNVANIMNKRFFVIIPYFPPLLKKEGFLDRLKSNLLMTKLPLLNFVYLLLSCAYRDDKLQSHKQLPAVPDIS